MPSLLELIRTIQLQRQRKRYTDEKLLTLKQKHAGDEGDIRTPIQKIRHLCIRYCPAICGGYRKRYDARILGWFGRFYLHCVTSGTFEHSIATSIIGFLVGLVVTSIMYMFFIFQLGMAIRTATLICIPAGMIISNCLAFSESARCLGLLILSDMSSKKARQALIAYAMVLAFSGPGKNTAYNLVELSRVLTCQQEESLKAYNFVMGILKRPFATLKESFVELAEAVHKAFDTVINIFKTFKRITLSVLSVLKSATQWLNTITGMCASKIGTPFDRCMQALGFGHDDCLVTADLSQKFMCSVNFLGKVLCFPLKTLDLLCGFFHFSVDSLVSFIYKEVTWMYNSIKAEAFVKVRFKHHGTMRFTDRNSDEVIKAVVNYAKDMFKVFVRLHMVSTIWYFYYIILVLTRVFVYRNLYMRYMFYDNYYITRHLVELDMKRAFLKKETIFPLNRREQKTYIRILIVSNNTILRYRFVRLSRKDQILWPRRVFTWKMAANENMKIGKFLFRIAMITGKIIFIIWFDYTVYQIMVFGKDLMTHTIQELERVPPQVEIRGTGIEAKIYKGISSIMQKKKLNINFKQCIPKPKSPNFYSYTHIGFVLIMIWVLSLLEPFSKRLRHVVMDYYHPDLAKQRASWLFNTILYKRVTFVSFTQRFLKTKFFGTKSGDPEPLPCLDVLRAKYPCIKYIVGKRNAVCMVCASTDDILIRCDRESCPGIYCQECCLNLNKVCAVCHDAVHPPDEFELIVETTKKIKLSEDIAAVEDEMDEELSEADSDLFYDYQEQVNGYENGLDEEDKEAEDEDEPLIDYIDTSVEDMPLPDIPKETPPE